MMTNTFWTVLILFIPLLLLIVRGRLRVRRALAMIERDGPKTPKPFEPAITISTALLARFPEPMRQYVREQFLLGRGGLIVLTWIFTVLLCTSQLPSNLAQKGARVIPPAAVWNAYLLRGHGTLLVSLFAALITGATAVSLMTAEAQSAFYRTRPLTLQFIFWTRTLAALATLLSAAMASVLLSLALVYALHGPAWQITLPGSHQYAIAGRADQWIALVQTSAPRLLLSALTTLTFAFSVCVALFAAPFGGRSKTRAGSIASVAILGGLAGQLPGLWRHNTAGSPFFYLRPGPPPPWLLLLVPLAAAVALLFLAQYLLTHRDI